MDTLRKVTEIKKKQNGKSIPWMNNRIFSGVVVNVVNFKGIRAIEVLFAKKQWTAL